MDVHSFTVNRSPIATITFLRTYFGATSELIVKDQAIQKILVPEIREKHLYEIKTKALNRFTNSDQDRLLKSKSYISPIDT